MSDIPVQKLLSNSCEEILAKINNIAYSTDLVLQLRFVRNSLGHLGAVDSRTSIIDQELQLKIFQICSGILQKNEAYFSDERDGNSSVKTCATVCLQVLGNLLELLSDKDLLNENELSLMWKSIIEERIEPMLYERSNDTDLINYVCMVLYVYNRRNLNLFVYRVQALFTKDQISIILDRLFNGIAAGFEWGLLMLELFFANGGHLTYVLFDACDRKSDFCIFFHELVKKQSIVVGESCAKFWIDYLLEISSEIINRSMNANASDFLASECTDCATSCFVEVMDIVCCLSSRTDTFRVVQSHPLLLTCAVSLLQSLLGVEKTKTVQQPKTEGSEPGSIVYGLKRCFVRLIGNLVYQNRENQDLIRTMEGIPMVLNCTPLDEQNPFVTQWAVWAIRNICEGCPENQKIIASLVRQPIGSDKNATMFEQAGLHVTRTLDGNIVIRQASQLTEDVKDGLIC